MRYEMELVVTQPWDDVTSISNNRVFAEGDTLEECRKKAAHTLKLDGWRLTDLPSAEAIVTELVTVYEVDRMTYKDIKHNLLAYMSYMKELAMEL